MGMRYPKRSKLNSKGTIARRKKATQMFEQGYRRADVAKALNASRSSAGQWYRTLKKEGKERLETIEQPGPQAALGSKDLEAIKAALIQGPQAFGYVTNVWTLERIARVVWKISHVRYHTSHIWRLLQQMGWSCQRPERRARERNEKAIRQWKEQDWPQVKKKPNR